jgi:hypothetical protein
MAKPYKTPVFRKNLTEKQNNKGSSLFFDKRMTSETLAYVFIKTYVFTVIFENFRTILENKENMAPKNKENMAPKNKDNMAKSQLSL